MKTVFYTIISDSHYEGCRTNEFISSFKKFHSDIDLVVFGQKEIDREFSLDKRLNFYNCKAHFAKLLYNDYDLVVDIDSDHLIFSRLDSILAADYDVAAPANFNVFANAFLLMKDSYGQVIDYIPQDKYLQGGLIASTSKEFWNLYHDASLKQASRFCYKENDILNLLTSLLDIKVKYLDGSGNFNDKEFHSYYGCASLGREKQFYIENDMIMLGGLPVKAYHFARAGIEKLHPRELFSKEVVDFIYSKIVI